jgi:hypothetical protein
LLEEGEPGQLPEHAGLKLRPCFAVKEMIADGEGIEREKTKIELRASQVKPLK